MNELEPGHFLTHLPKSRKCNVCLQAKLTATPHRRRDNQSSNLQEARDQEEPKGPEKRIEVHKKYVVMQSTGGEWARLWNLTETKIEVARPIKC